MFVLFLTELLSYTRPPWHGRSFLEHSRQVRLPSDEKRQDKGSSTVRSNVACWPWHCHFMKVTKHYDVTTPGVRTLWRHNSRVRHLNTSVSKETKPNAVRSRTAFMLTPNTNQQWKAYTEGLRYKINSNDSLKMKLNGDIVTKYR